MLLKKINLNVGNMPSPRGRFQPTPQTGGFFKQGKGPQVLHGKGKGLQDLLPLPGAGWASLTQCPPLHFSTNLAGAPSGLSAIVGSTLAHELVARSQFPNFLLRAPQGPA